MTVYKQYTNDQYDKFFQNAFSSNFGISEDKIINHFLASGTSVIKSYGCTVSTMKNKYVPLLKSMLNGGYVMFLLISIEEGGGAGNWINHYMHDTANSGYGCMRDDCKYILSIINNMHSNPAYSAYEVMGGSPYVEDTSGSTRKALNACKAGTIGRYYIPSTMAGNSWVFGTKWSEQHQGSTPPSVYYGNPYDGIINAIKKLGGDPFKGDSSDQKHSSGDGLPKNDQTNVTPQFHFATIKPGKIYLNGAVFKGCGVKFRRFKNWLTVKYALNISTGNSQSTSNTQATQSQDKSGHDLKVEKAMSVLNRMQQQQFTYSNARPSLNPNICGYCDCSGFVGWIIHDIYPTIWNNGYINTGTMYTHFKSIGCIVYEGSMNSFKNEYMNKVKKGDILIMGENPLSGAGNSQHTGIMSGDGKDAPFCNQSGSKTFYTASLNWFMTSYYTNLNYPYFCVVRFK